jgi:tetratricopeptide (TPR) repeat protein
MGQVMGPSRQQRANRAYQLRQRSYTWEQIAEMWEADYPTINPRIAFRWAHNLTHQDIAEAWNKLDPAEPTMTKARIVQFENWPVKNTSGNGRRPSIANLKMLARIFRTSARRLLTDDENALYDNAAHLEIAGIDFRYLDDNQSVRAATPEPDRPSAYPGRTLGSSSGTLTPGIEVGPHLSLGNDIYADRVDANYIQEIRESSHHFVAIDGLYGGKDILPLALRVFQAAHSKLGNASLRPTIQRDLEAAAGEAGEVVAWLAYDADSQSISRQIIHEALLLSRLAGDREMELFELNHLAMQSLYLRRPREAMRIADDVLDEGRLPPRVVALFDIRRGRASAQYGDRERALRALDKARSALDSSITARDPKWTWWVDEAEVIWHRATAHAELGEWHDAVLLFQEATSLRPSSRRSAFNNAAHFLDSLVRVHAWRDAEETLINDVIPKTEEIRSMRTTNLLLRTIGRIEKSRDVATSTLVDSATDLRHLLRSDRLRTSRRPSGT